MKTERQQPLNPILAVGSFDLNAERSNLDAAPATKMEKKANVRTVKLVTPTNEHNRKSAEFAEPAANPQPDLPLGYINMRLISNGSYM